MDASSSIFGLLRRFAGHARGNVAIIFAVASAALAVGVGAGLDLSGAYAARQRLSEVATLTCQYSVRVSVINTQSSNAAVAADPGNTFQYYLATVNTFATNALTAQHMNAAQVTDTSGGTSTYFSATNGANGPTGGYTDLSMNYPTSFLKIMRVTNVPVHARINCANASSTTQTVPGGGGSGNSLVLSEGFETSCTSYCFTQPSGVGGALLNPTTTFGSAPTYTGDAGFAWYVIGYCLEVDAVGVINASDPQGTHSSELDCDNSNHTAGNSSMSTKVFLNAGSYELRYFYRSRIQYPDYDPYYICGTTLADVSWANDTNAPSDPIVSNALRTNQMNVYLDPTTSSAMPPLHYTVNSPTSPTQQLAGSNLDDVCVYSYKWIERSITINVSASGYFWLSFAADGQNDSYGAQLDDIRLCPGSCSTSLQLGCTATPCYPQDNFPDTTPQTGPSVGTQTSALVTALTNATWNWNTYTGTYFTPMCTYSNFAYCANLSTTADTNTVLLDPGFYELTYQYLSLATFSGAPVTGCDSTPASSDISAMSSKSVTASYTKVGSGSTYATKADVDMQAVFLSFPGQTLTPNVSGAVTATNPLIDLCYYSTSPVTRKIGIQITKPGMYNLSFFAAGSASSSKYFGGTFGTFSANNGYNAGATISSTPSSISIKPLGSPYTLAASSNCPPIPVPNPQVGAAQTPAAGYTITQTDPFQFGSSSSACAPQ